ncbi:neuferricin-like [Babylonia areolata]|uniref:neuferricin-like n=1 Tax=Babylonia areolata TaxID=304850 RepID=UPI003FD55197
MGRLFLLTSLLICALAVFFSLDSFAPIRSQMAENFPNAVKQFFTGLVDFISRKDKLFTKEELSKYTGQSGGPVYLAVLGNVFDVTRGKKHYGPGGGYSFFSGRDGSRAFVSGDFTEQGLTDDVSGFTTAEVLTLEEWEGFYRRDYTYVGKLIGNFYDVNGKSTAALAQYKETLQKALAEKKAEEDLRQIFPPCNSQWSQGGHTHVWCTDRSGGIQRDWVGVPRQFYEPGKAQEKARCVCVRNKGPPSDSQHSDSHKNRGDLDNPNLKAYDGCDVNADSCSYIKSGD